MQTARDKSKTCQHCKHSSDGGFFCHVSYGTFMTPQSETCNKFERNEDITMNYMEQIAGVFGVKMGEHFGIKSRNGLIIRNDAWFDEDGVHDTHGFLEHAIYDLVTGRFEVAKKPWIPNKGERYYYVANDRYGDVRVMDEFWTPEGADKRLYFVRNVYRTQEEAEKNLEKWKRFYKDGWMNCE